MPQTGNRTARALLCVLTASSLICAAPASAQLSGLFKKKTAPAETGSTECDTNATESPGKSVLGGFMRNLTGRATSQLGMVGSFVPSAEVAGILTDAIACKLDQDEQKQAAEATLQATRGEEVGSSSEWTSNTRQNVSGRSTVTARNANSDGGSCMNVTDVIIVEGEETKVSKRMCKKSGEARYTIVA